MSTFAAIFISVVVLVVVVVVWSCLVAAKHADQVAEDMQRDDLARLRRMKGAA